MTGPLPHLDELIPHQGPMRLIDRVLSQDEDVVRAEATIPAEGHAFAVEGRGVPVYAGFEMMAQTICAHDGLKRWREGKPPAIGFLLGCRRYAASREWFTAGEVLTIESRQLIEGETASFECRILDRSGNETASGVVNVYRPDDVEAFLRGDRPI